MVPGCRVAHEQRVHRDARQVRQWSVHFLRVSGADFRRQRRDNDYHLHVANHSQCLFAPAAPDADSAVLPAGAAQPASAPSPASGGTPNESGSGYGLDYQDGVLIVQAYSYLAGGAARGTSAPETSPTTCSRARSTSTPAARAISCTYKAPTLVGYDGQITITFTSPTTARHRSARRTHRPHRGGTSSLRHVRDRLAHRPALSRAERPLCDAVSDRNGSNCDRRLSSRSSRTRGSLTGKNRLSALRSIAVHYITLAIRIRA